MGAEEALSFVLNANVGVDSPGFEDSPDSRWLIMSCQIVGRKKLRRCTNRIRVNDLNFLLPAIRGVASHPEHPAKHALQPVLHVTGLDPSRLGERSLLVKICDKNGL